MPASGESENGKRTRPRANTSAKRRRKNNASRTVLLVVILGFGVLVLVATGVIVAIQMSSHRDRDSATTRNTTTSSGQKSASDASLGPELLLNGSFEDGPAPDADGPGFTPYEAGSNAIPGWNITRGSVDYISFYWQHADGKRSIDLNGNEPGAIAQTFRTRPGRKYRVTFSIAGNFCGGGEPTLRTMTVTAAGSRTEFSFDTNGRNYEDMGWVGRTWEFTAIAEETTLEFSSTTELPVACGPALDRVSVKEIGN